MYNVEWSMEAIEDVENHQNYIEKDSPVAAKKWTLKIYQKSDLLRENAFLGRIIPEENQPNRRELIVGNFRLMYEVLSDTTILILKVRRSKQAHR